MAIDPITVYGPSRAISDLTSLDSVALAAANSRCNFTNPPLHVRLDMIHKQVSNRSPWIIGLGTSGSETYSSSSPGPGILFSTGASSTDIQGATGVAGSTGSAWISDLVSASSKWHVRWYFKFTSTPSANTRLALGWVDPGGGLVGPSVGVFGSASTAKFAFARLNWATHTLSTVNIDQGDHKVDMWANGAAPGTVFFSFDNETTKTVTGATFGLGALPFFDFACTDAGAAQSVILKPSFYTVDTALSA